MKMIWCPNVETHGALMLKHMVQKDRWGTASTCVSVLGLRVLEVADTSQRMPLIAVVMERS